MVKGDYQLCCTQCEWRSDPFDGENFSGGFAGVALHQYKEHFVRHHLPEPTKLDLTSR